MAPMKMSSLFLALLISTIELLLLSSCASLQPSPTTVPVINFASYPAQVLGVVIDPNGKVLDVEPGSAAEQAGIAGGDVIQKINNLSVTSQRQQVQTAILETKPGRDVMVLLQRNGNDVVLSVKPSPPPAGRASLATATPVAAPNEYL